MSKNLAFSFRIDAEVSAALQKLDVLKQKLASSFQAPKALTGADILPEGISRDIAGRLRSANGRFLTEAERTRLGLENVKKSAAGLPGSFGTAAAGLGPLIAGFAAVAAAASGVGLAFKKGLDINAQTESATLGIKGLIAAMFDVRDASGNLSKGPEQLAIAGAQAEEQIRALRIAGLQTSATFEQLLGAFQGAVGAGAGAGLKLDEIRELTIGIVQAAGALTVPMAQINQEVRSILSGQVSADSTVANSLQITNAMLKRWKEAGTLSEELNKRLEAFRRLGPEASLTWESTLSNLQDAMALFLGGATKDAFSTIKTALQQGMAGAFDQNGDVAAGFKDLQDVAGIAFSGIGQVLADAISGGVSLAAELSGWFNKHADEVALISNAAGVLYDNVKSVLSTIVSAIGAVVGLGVETGAVYGVFGSIALIVAMIQDGFQLWKGVLAEVGAYVLDKVGGPLRTVLGALRDFLAQIPGIGAGLASAVDGILKAIPASGAGLRGLAKGIQADFDAGRTAVARTNAELSKTGAELRAQASERAREGKRGAKATGGTATPKKQAPSDDAAKGAKKAAEQYSQALKAYADAELDVAKKAAAAQREIAGAELEEALANRLTTQEQYLIKKAALERSALASEIAAIRAKEAVLKAELSKETDPAKRKKAEADLLKLSGDIKALEAKGIVIDTKLRIDTEAFRREVESLRVDIKANILDLEGNAFGAGKERLQQETQTLLRDPRVSGDEALTAAVNRQSQLKEQQLQLTEQKRLSDERVQFLTLAEERIALNVQTGKLTTVQAEREIRDARLQTADAILAQVSALEALAAANPQNSEMALGAARARLEYDKLKTTLDATATSLNREIAGGVSSFVDGLTRGEGAINSLGAALSNVFGSLAKRALKGFEDMLFNALEGKNGQGIGGMLAGLFGGGGGSKGGSGFFSAISSAFGFAEGGYTGNGGKYQPKGVVHGGEYVFTKAEVQRAGLPFFYGLKNQIRGGRKMPGYAEGGLVGGGFSGVAAAMPAPQFTNNNHNQNNMFVDMDDVARKLGRNAILGRDVTRIIFEDSASRLERR